MEMLLSVADVCRTLGVSRTQVWKLGKAGEITGVKIGARGLYTRDSVAAYVDRLVEEAERKSSSTRAALAGKAGAA